MKNIKKMLDNLEKQKLLHEKEIFNYKVPQLWNTCQLKSIPTYDCAMIVNPYEFYYENIKAICKGKANKNYLKPLSQLTKENGKDGSWIKKAFAYSSMIRTSAAYDHDGDGYLKQSNLYGLKETGTFMKFILLIPYLKEMGIDTIYLLPFFQSSDYDKKGEFGSCYALSDFFAIDPTLKDPMLDELSVDEECKAFMEACHMNHIRIIIDIIPRTNAIRSKLLKEHPDWFYWIKLDAAKNFKAPDIASVPKLSVATNEVMEKVYQDEAIQPYLASFSYDPKTLDEKRYLQLLDKVEKEKSDLLDEIEKNYGITIACAFSDQVNDPQPVWSDVTFLRMYLDHPQLASRFINEDQPPYILYDVAKANLHPGKIENRELWNMLASIIPYYQKHFGIDGVRIDMGHALPIKLVDEIISKAKAFDSDTCIIAEELDIKNDKISLAKGYNMILGNGFSEECRIQEHRLHDFYYGARNLACPLFALCETHDTPRIAARKGGKTLAKMLTIMNLFTPNGVAFLNSGQEFYEVQPMNLGLDATPKEKERLNKKDPRYQKLALFDAFNFTYDEFDLYETLKNIIPIRQDYLSSIIDLDKSIPAWFNTPNDLGFGSFFHKEDRAILVVANANLEEDSVYNIQLENVLSKLSFYPKKCDELFSTHTESKKGYIESLHHIYVDMKPGEVKIIEIK
ncbi:MAG: alpha-amylase [Erysipelotrichia bacterium]|nr:alpha-amylase [Erysipelotrichia bacterium]NCC54396.1 alpha-amylase [Erysipelotrichia bacterium]